MAKTAPQRKEYIPAVTPGLRRLLVVVFALTALLGANSVYLVAVTILESASGGVYQNYFYQYMFLGHLVLGLALLLPFLIFGVLHIRNAWRRKNRRAVWIGYFLFAVSISLLASGLPAYTRAGTIGDTRRGGAERLLLDSCRLSADCGLAVLAASSGRTADQVARRAELSHARRRRRRWLAWSCINRIHVPGTRSARTRVRSISNRRSRARPTVSLFHSGPLQNDAYCKECHADAHAGWAASAHRFSSFNKSGLPGQCP